MKPILMASIILILAAGISVAQVPGLINYQGWLTDADDKPVNGPQLIKFNIYDSEAGPTPLWSSGFQTVQVNEGLFSYPLGTDVPFPPNLFKGGDTRYLGITVGADLEISPRTRITSTAYSGVSGYAWDIADDVVTQDKIADDAVQSMHIQNHSILFEDIGYDAITGDLVQDGSLNLGDIGQNGASNGQVMKWNSSYSVWEPANDETGADGDITEVAAGSGLTGGGTSGAVTISVAKAGITSTHIEANAISGDLVQDGSLDLGDIGQNGASNGQVMKWNNSLLSWEPADDEVGPEGDITEVAAGSGLTGGGTSGAVTVSIANAGITSTHIGPNAVGNSELADNAVATNKIINNTILDADISNTADIAISKINGTAVNLNSPQTITGPKTFTGDVFLGDTIMRVSSTGIGIGSNVTPSSEYLINIGRTINASVSTGQYLTITNENETGIVNGIEVESISNHDAVGISVFTEGDNIRKGISSQVDNRTAAGAGSGYSYGVRGESYGGGTGYGGHFTAGGAITGYGVYGNCGPSNPNRYGVYGTCQSSNGNWGGYFYGNLHSTGTSTKGGGGYKIDHPQNPENMYLAHSDVSSPEMKNIYDGVVTTDSRGRVEVQLPDYFESLNSDFRYQLTVVGTFAQAIISEEISGNRFVIETDKPNVKVSWQVTGIRKDAFARAASREVESAKVGEKQGRYIHPEVFGFGIDRAVDYENHQEAADTPEANPDRREVEP